MLCPDPNSLLSLLRSQGLRQLRGSRAVEMHWFLWKEIDGLFTIAVTLLPRKTQPMADNYLGRQSWTGGAAEVQLFHATFSSSWHADSTQAARSGGTSVTGSNPSDWLSPGRNQKHKFKTMQGDRVYNFYCEHTDTDWRAEQTRQHRVTSLPQTRGNAGGNGCDTTSCSASPCTDMPVQNFESNRMYLAVLKRIRSLMLMFCRNILLLWNILPYNQMFACKANSSQVH